MARDDKQLSFEQRYKDKMETYKEIYKERTDFASKFKRDTSKTKLDVAGLIGVGTPSSGGTGSASSPSDVSGGSVTVANASEAAKKVLALAQSFIGKCVYRWGGKDPTTGGADCSGFIHYIYKNALGLEVGGSTSEQDNAGTEVSKDQAQPGDIIMFQNTYRPGPSHVGIVYEWPKIIHCGGKEGTDGVQWSEVKDGNYYARKFRSIRRVIKENSSSNSSGDGASSKAISVYSVNATTTTISYTSDDDGMDTWVLSGNEKTSTPDAPPGWIVPPLHWLDGATYKPIKVNRAAQYIYPPKMNRANFIYERIGWARDTEFSSFEQLDSEKFIHISRHDGLEGNLYSPDAKKAFEIFLLKSKREKLEILSGFRFSPDGLLSPHEAGCAIDIRAYGYKDARELADIAWACGFRAIAIGGDIQNDGGFVHLDIGPQGEWGYDGIPAYQGPGRWY